MHKSALLKTAKYILFVLAFAAVATALFCMVNRWGKEQSREAEATATPKYTIVIDAGHGGEDGGTQSAQGVFEKNLNLDIAMKLKDLLEAAGVHVIMTRTEDVLLYDRNVDFHGRKKVLDLAARLAAGEKANPDLFLSIHMNSFPDSRYSGLQVWYSPNEQSSKAYAEAVQDLVVETLQPQNTRRVKAAGSNIFLLDRLTCPAILVECGFLSNPEEAEKLASAEYRDEMVFILAAAILSSLEKEVATP